MIKLPNKNSKIEIRIDETEKTLIQNYAKKHDLSVSELIRTQFLSKIIEEERKNGKS